MKIALKSIKHNPHRNMTRNPIDPDQVDVLIDSFERNGVWPNIVVRRHPKKDGEFQLAYGHHRLAAMKKLGIVDSNFIVEKLDDWGMYTAMVDENEGQKRMTPELIFENIESGIKHIEPLVKKAKTLDEFMAKVPRGTVVMRPEEYSKVRNNVLSGEGLGVKFLGQILPGEKSTRPANIQTVVDSHYGAAKASAKQHRAEAKRSEAKAAKSREKAERLEREAQALEDEAGKLRKYGVAKKVLLSLDSPKAMSGFASSVKALGIPKERHADAVKYLSNNEVPARNYRQRLARWWHVASGRAAAERLEEDKKRWSKKVPDQTLEEFAGNLSIMLVNMNKKIDAITKFANAFEDQEAKGRLLDRANVTLSKLEAMVLALEADQSIDASGEYPLLGAA